MEQPTDAQSLVEQGDALLMRGNAAEAASEYTRAVQADPSAVAAHLGLAKAYFALGSFGYVYPACQQVQRLAPASADAAIAQAILLTLDHRYDAAISELDRAEKLSPGRAYVHALRGYCYRRLGNSFDAMSAESKAARLSGVRDWKPLFPQEPVLKPVPEPAEGVVAFPTQDQTAAQTAPRGWDQRSPAQRRVVQARFATRGVPVVTYSLIAINIAIFVLELATGGSFLDTTGSSLVQIGAQKGALVLSDPIQAYRIFTAMFLHESIEHILFNMLSLYFIGIWVEQIFGKWRYLLIYFLGGILAGITQALVTPDVASLGASGAIFAIFGAFGAFFLIRRRALGSAGNAIIGQWIFWLAFNLWFSFSQPGIGVWDHIGGLLAGFVLGVIFTNMAATQRRS